MVFTLSRRQSALVMPRSGLTVLLSFVCCLFLLAQYWHRRQERMSAKNSVSARTRITCPSPTPRARVTRTRSPSCLPRSWVCGEVLLFPAAARLHSQYVTLQIARFRLSLRLGNERAEGIRSGVGDQALLSFDWTIVFPKGKGLDAVKSSEDFLALPKDKLQNLKIGIYDRSPASAWLVRHQLTDQGVPYRIMNADPDQYPGEILEKDRLPARSMRRSCGVRSPATLQRK